MRDYGKVHTGFWASETLRECDSDAKVLALYLLTSPHTHQAGVFRLPTAYACDDLGWVSERLENCFETLSKTDWLIRCKKTGWLWIRKFSKFNPPDNPNQKKAIDKQLALVPENCSFRSELLGLQEPLPNGSGNLLSLSPVPSHVSSIKTRAKAKHAMPADFGVSERVRAWATEKGFTRLPEHLEAFRTQAQAKGYTYADWDAAFMNAIRDDWAKLRSKNAEQQSLPRLQA